ncbi:MAG: ISAs1 family transposase, partial [Spirulinaceae cyanobacterium]
LKTFLELPNGVPSADTFARVISNLDPEAMETGFQSWVSHLAESLVEQLIAIDGKTSRGSYDREEGVKALQLVSAWASEQRLVLGQCAVSSKSNEITAIPVLIEQLDVKGAMVSIDAMGTQTTIAKHLRDKGADYLLALKGNQGNLHQQAEAWFADYEAGAVSDKVSQYESCEAGHHRIEQRQVWCIPADEVFSPEQCEAWANLASLVVVRAERRLWNKTTLETRYFLSSATLSAQAFALKVRGHWGIENPLHWSLDVVFGEDRSRLRRDHAPRNFSLLRRLSL